MFVGLKKELKMLENDVRTEGLNECFKVLVLLEEGQNTALC